MPMEGLSCCASRVDWLNPRTRCRRECKGIGTIRSGDWSHSGQWRAIREPSGLARANSPSYFSFLITVVSGSEYAKQARACLRLKLSLRHSTQSMDVSAVGRPQRRQLGSATSGNLLWHGEQIIGPNFPHAAQTEGNNKLVNLLDQNETLLGLAGSLNIGLRLWTRYFGQNVLNKFSAF